MVCTFFKTNQIERHVVLVSDTDFVLHTLISSILDMNYIVRKLQNVCYGSR